MSKFFKEYLVGMTAIVAAVLCVAVIFLLAEVKELQAALVIGIGGTGETLTNQNETLAIQLDVLREIDVRLDRLDAEIFTMPDNRWFGEQLEIDSRLDVLDYETEGDYGYGKQINSLYGRSYAIEADLCNIYAKVPALATEETWSICFSYFMHDRSPDQHQGSSAFLSPVDEIENFDELIGMMQAFQIRLENTEKDQNELLDNVWAIWEELYMFPADSGLDNDLDFTAFRTDLWQKSHSRLDYVTDKSENTWTYIMDVQLAICEFWDMDYVFPFCGH